MIPDLLGLKDWASSSLNPVTRIISSIVFPDLPSD